VAHGDRPPDVGLVGLLVRLVSPFLIATQRPVQGLRMRFSFGSLLHRLALGTGEVGWPLERGGPLLSQVFSPVDRSHPPHFKGRTKKKRSRLSSTKLVLELGESPGEAGVVGFLPSSCTLADAAPLRVTSR
jgi:hypothetical protein